MSTPLDPTLLNGFELLEAGWIESLLEFPDPLTHIVTDGEENHNLEGFITSFLRLVDLQGYPIESGSDKSKTED